TDAQAKEVNATLEKYNAELKENGKASKETREMLVKATEDLQNLKENNDDVSQKLIDINQKLADGFSPKGFKSVGQTVVESTEFKSYLNGEINKMTVQVKNTIVTETGSP